MHLRAIDEQSNQRPAERRDGEVCYSGRYTGQVAPAPAVGGEPKKGPMTARKEKETSKEDLPGRWGTPGNSKPIQGGSVRVV